MALDLSSHSLLVHETVFLLDRYIPNSRQSFFSKICRPTHQDWRIAPIAAIFATTLSLARYHRLPIPGNFPSQWKGNDQMAWQRVESAVQTLHNLPHPSNQVGTLLLNKDLRYTIGAALFVLPLWLEEVSSHTSFFDDGWWSSTSKVVVPVPLCGWFGVCWWWTGMKTSELVFVWLPMELLKRSCLFSHS